jgi:hypothetical protein
MPDLSTTTYQVPAVVRVSPENSVTDNQPSGASYVDDQPEDSSLADLFIMQSSFDSRYHPRLLCF